MAILIDELMKDRELMGWYIFLLVASADSEELTTEKAEKLTDSIFGENDKETVELAMSGIKIQTDYAKGAAELLKRRHDTMQAISEE